MTTLQLYILNVVVTADDLYPYNPHVSPAVGVTTIVVVHLILQFKFVDPPPVLVPVQDATSFTADDVFNVRIPTPLLNSKNPLNSVIHTPFGIVNVAPIRVIVGFNIALICGNTSNLYPIAVEGILV
jgi:hypothetical protein